MKIICPTQLDSITSFQGATGINYTSIRGQAFEVYDPVDAEHLLKNKRLKKASILGLTPAPQKKIVEDEKKDLKAWADKIPGLSEKGEKTLAKTYASKKMVFDAYVAGKNFEELSDKDREALLKIINEEMEAE